MKLALDYTAGLVLGTFEVIFSLVGCDVLFSARTLVEVAVLH